MDSACPPRRGGPGLPSRESHTLRARRRPGRHSRLARRAAATDAGRRGAVRGTAAPLAARPSSERPEHRLGLLQICCLKALGEPAVDRRQELPRLLPLTLALPQLAQAHCRLELKRLGLLAARHVEGLLQTDFSCPALGWRAVLC